MNRFSLTGNLGQDARIQSGRRGDGSEYEFALLNVAVSTPQGRGETRTDWFSIAVFNPRLVDLMKSYGHKGKKLLIEGDMVRYTEGEGDQRRDLTKFRCGFNARIELLSPSGEARAQARTEDTATREYAATTEQDMDHAIPF
ncbi:single-stranded DNA-binding protein [Maricaulis sp.]|uniref:single-stranded DNA-binding protein n=1 Tax=Maricaulis sp. TaxID=1486257 RepID=UPI002636A8F8|nr:single-stranded DNA-binding protein [Maricaulis sp.]MDF1769434.1 single-stranded DNA-binding protein [Maricaulis sp.]